MDGVASGMRNGSDVHRQEKNMRGGGRALEVIEARLDSECEEIKVVLLKTERQTHAEKVAIRQLPT